MNNNTFYSPVNSQRRNRSNESFGEFVLPKPNFSPVYTSSPRDVKDNSQDFLSLEFSSPVKSERSRGGSESCGKGGRWRDKSFSSNSSGWEGGFISNIRRGYPRSPYGSGRPGGGRNNNFPNQSGNTDISVFYHPSMIQDPWVELEKNLRTSGTEISANSATSSKSEVTVGGDDDDDTDNSTGIIEVTVD